jgi:hypothetical protein
MDSMGRNGLGERKYFTTEAQRHREMGEEGEKGRRNFFDGMTGFLGMGEREIVVLELSV